MIATDPRTITRGLDGPSLPGAGRRSPDHTNRDAPMPRSCAPGVGGSPHAGTGTGSRGVCRGTTGTATRGSTLSSIVAVDTETTSIRPDRRAWEVALILPQPPEWLTLGRFKAEVEPGRFRWFVSKGDLDLGNADPFALKVGGFYDRHPQFGGESGYVAPEAEVMRDVERLTRGLHLLGAVPSFDADVLDRRMRAHGILPSWHYHLCDIEAMAVGWLHARLQDDEVDPRYAPVGLPWKSDDLSRACGVEPPSDEDRHSALGDASWALRWYDAITGGKP